jgi:methionine aminotransferase
MAEFFARKRALLAAGLAGSTFAVRPAAGRYVTLVDYSRCPVLAGLADMAAASRLLEPGGVATIPLPPFYRVQVRRTLLRLCFAKQEATLGRGIERLRALG